MKKKNKRTTPAAARDGSRRNGTAPDQRLESAVDQLLETEPASDGGAVWQGSSAARNGGSNGAGRKTKEQEIESLLERMILCEEAFVEYSH